VGEVTPSRKVRDSAHANSGNPRRGGLESIPMTTIAVACALAGLIFVQSVFAQNPLSRPDPFIGAFQGDGVTLEITGARGQYSGSLTVQGNRLPVTLKSSGSAATGTFVVEGRTYSFTLMPTSGGLKLTSDGAEYNLTRRTDGDRPADPAANQSRSGSIVGSWRNGTGSARFNADGTGSIDGQPGRYEIRGNQLTLIGAQGQLALQFEVRGDTLSLIANGQTILLNRVKEETGPGSIRPELVGKWCWISVVNAQQGARQSSQCVTLEANGSYVYAGGSDSYNPNGGLTTQSSDSGTWTATETTITARSRTGKTTVYTLEKRNHPKNNDPMIVLNGQPFVTYYNKPPW
jgi:hypothetical protein